MLENDDWRTRMHEKNVTLMKKNYATITRFLREKDIRYYEMYESVKCPRVYLRFTLHMSIFVNHERL